MKIQFTYNTTNLIGQFSQNLYKLYVGFLYFIPTKSFFIWKSHFQHPTLRIIQPLWEDLVRSSTHMSGGKALGANDIYTERAELGVQGVPRYPYHLQIL